MTNPCKEPNCPRPSLARGWCSMHWQRWKRGLPMSGPPYYAHGWTHKGYRWISLGRDREVLEHRHLMEQQLGRKLRTDECVHHKNGDKLDNRLENLEVVDRAKHTSIHQNEGGERRPAVCTECGRDFLRLSWTPNQTCSQSCGMKRSWRQRRDQKAS